LATKFSQVVAAFQHLSRIRGFIDQTYKRFASIESCPLFSNARWIAFIILSTIEVIVNNLLPECLGAEVVHF
jgi:hypothetical protein